MSAVRIEGPKGSGGWPGADRLAQSLEEPLAVGHDDPAPVNPSRADDAKATLLQARPGIRVVGQFEMEAGLWTHYVES